MNKPLQSLTGNARYFAEKSMLPEFDGIDRGNDDLSQQDTLVCCKGRYSLSCCNTPVL